MRTERAEKHERSNEGGVPEHIGLRDCRNSPSEIAEYASNGEEPKTTPSLGGSAAYEELARPAVTACVGFETQKARCGAHVRQFNIGLSLVATK